MFVVKGAGTGGQGTDRRALLPVDAECARPPADLLLPARNRS